MARTDDPFAKDDEKTESSVAPKIEAVHDENEGEPNVYGLPDSEIEKIRNGEREVDYADKHPLAGKCTCREVAGELVKERGQPDRIVNSKGGARIRIANPDCPVGSHGPY